MNLFFWRIFLSFWLANILIVGGLIWTTGWIAGRDDFRPAERVHEYMDFSLRSAAQAVETGKVMGLSLRQARRGPIQLTIYDESGNALSRGRGKPDFAEVLKALDSGGESITNGRKTRAVKARAPDGTEYVLSVTARAPPSPLLALSSQGSRLRFLIALITSGAISFALARYFAGPIRRLRRATQQLASGDLTAQVDVPEGRRGDDLIQLGRDFNDMARRLRSSYVAQTNLLLDLSHELRSPLARLQVAVELLQRKSSSDSAVELERIEMEVARLNGLIGEILDLTRQSAGSASNQVSAEVDVNELLEEICEDARFEAGQAESVTFEPSTQVGIVNGRADSLRSCFENIVRNALRHGNAGVKVSSSIVGPEIRVLISDEGPGVPPSELERLFEPFFRSSTHAESGGGAGPSGFGLGLAIVKAVVDTHGGSVVARSPGDGGLEVEVSLPLSASQN